jgi:hypothetical protein
MSSNHAAHAPEQRQDTMNVLKGWVMIILTIVLLALYGAALGGWLKPLASEYMVTRLEPLIFVVVGYYFGRLPSQQNESTLKDEIGRQTRKADSAQHAKEHAQQACEALEEKLKNVRATLAFAPTASHDRRSAVNAATSDPATQQTIATVLKILDS